MSYSTSTDYAHPHRPWLARGINRMGHLLIPGRPHLSRHTLMTAARRAEHDGDFGPAPLEEPLGILLDAIEREAALTPTGRFITQQRLINLLRNRLRVARLLEAHPEIEDLPLPPVILITGLQRTGTTLLHRLLATDPAHRALLSYEALNPAPLHPNPDVDRRRKIKTAVMAEKTLRFLAPDFFAIHPVEALSPEEDVLLLDYALMSTVAESTMNVPTYAAWVEAQDNRPAYRYMRTLLKVLSWGHPERTWVLKSPHHLEFLEEFFDVFPGATVVMTSRSPIATLPSFCSMMAHGRGIFSDRVDPKAIGRQWLRKTAYMLERSRRARTHLPPDRFVDVVYDDLLARPLDQVARIYDAAGRPLDPGVRAPMEAALKKNGQHKYGVHVYAPEPFGLTPKLIERTYKGAMT